MLSAGRLLMVDYESARKAMIDSQVSAGAVTERRLLSAMGRIPREQFVPETRRGLAYIDDLHDLGNGRFMPTPAVFARLVQLAAIEPHEHVLEIGSGTGYGTAVLSALGHHVVGVEAEPVLAEKARANLAALHITNASIETAAPIGNGARFDAIIVEGALDFEPSDLLSLLRPGGRLVALIRNGRVGIATRFVATQSGFRKESDFNATLPPLNPAAMADEFVF
jgi:protein-L-isoaspartate(D-aspartate) O-methyltransferase